MSGPGSVLSAWKVSATSSTNTGCFRMLYARCALSCTTVARSSDCISGRSICLWVMGR